MRDLEIRGAGDILGAEQHGHMAQVGYDLYCKMIDAAVKEAKGETVKTEHFYWYVPCHMAMNPEW